MLAAFIVAMFAMVCIAGAAAVYEENTEVSAAAPASGDKITFTLPDVSSIPENQYSIALADPTITYGALAGNVFTYSAAQDGDLVFTLNKNGAKGTVTGLATDGITVDGKIITVPDTISFEAGAGAGAATVTIIADTIDAGKSVITNGFAYAYTVTYIAGFGADNKTTGEAGDNAKVKLTPIEGYTLNYGTTTPHSGVITTFNDADKSYTFELANGLTVLSDDFKINLDGVTRTITPGELGGMTVGNGEVLTLATGEYTVSADKTFQVNSGGKVTGTGVNVSVSGTVVMSAKDALSISSGITFTLNKGATVIYTDWNSDQFKMVLSSDVKGVAEFLVKTGVPSVAADVTGGIVDMDGNVKTFDDFNVGKNAVVNVNSGKFTVVNASKIIGTLNVDSHFDSSLVIDLVGTLNVGADAICQAGVIFPESGKGVFNAEAGAILAGMVDGIVFGVYTDDENDTSSVVTEAFSVTNVKGDLKSEIPILTGDHSDVAGAIADLVIGSKDAKMAIVDLYTSYTVSGSLVIGENIIVNLPGELAVLEGGIVDFNAKTTMKNDARIVAETGLVTVYGNLNIKGTNTITSINELDVKDDGVATALGMITVNSGDATEYKLGTTTYFEAFESALSKIDTVDKKTIYPMSSTSITAAKDLTIPAGTTVEAKFAATITITLSKDASLVKEGTATNVKIVGETEYDVGTTTVYAGLANALKNAPVGSTITMVAKEITLGANSTLAEGVTLDIPAEIADRKLTIDADDVITFTVKGDISIASGAALKIGSEMILSVEGGSIVDNNTLAGIVVSPTSEIWVKAGFIDGLVTGPCKMNAVVYPDGIRPIFTTLVDALKENTRFVNVYGKITSEAATVQDGTTLIVNIGAVLTADLTIEEGAALELYNAPKNADPAGAKFVGSIVLNDNATVVVTADPAVATPAAADVAIIDGAVTYGENTMKFSLASVGNDTAGKDFIITATPEASDVPDCMVISATAGVATVYAGSVVANGYIVLSNGVFNLNGDKTIFQLETGTVDVKTLDLEAGKFLVGITPKNVSADKPAVMKGTFTIATGAKPVFEAFANADLSDVTLTGFDKTVFSVIVGGNIIAYATQYASSTTTTPMDLTEPVLDGVKFIGWYNAAVNGKLISETGTKDIGTLETVYGYTQAVTYNVTLTATTGVKYIVDGVEQAGVLSLLPGTHTVSVQATSGWDVSAAKITGASGVTVSGSTMTVSGDGSVSVSGVTPEKKASGMSITDILMIVLVVVVVILAIVIVMRMMRS